MYDVGNIVLAPHMFLSSRRHLRKPEPAGLRTSSAYRGGEREVEERDLATHPVQKVNEPYCISAADALYKMSISLSMKDIADLIVKLGKRAVETKELFQGVGR